MSLFQTSVPVPSPASGIIEERYVEDGTTVKAGVKLFKLKLVGMDSHCFLLQSSTNCKFHKYTP